MPPLNTGTSVIDFLKSTGKASDFTSRKSLYDTSGLRERLGDYTGSGSQNVAFLKQLQTQTPTLPSSQSTPRDPNFNPNFALQTPTASTQPTRDPNFNPNYALQTPTQTPTAGTAPVTETPDQGMTAYGALSALGYSTPSGEDVAKSALESTAFRTFQEGQGIKGLGIESRAAEERAKLEQTAASDTKKTIESFGSRGLFFSGMREGAVDDIVTNLASSKLGVDRDVALKLLEQGQATKEEFIKIAGDIAKKAQEGNKQALEILKDQGLTIGLDGKLTPTLAARSMELSAQREERVAKQADEAARIAVERLRLAEDSAARADARLALSEAADQRAQIKLDRLIQDQALGATASERLRNTLKPIFSNTAINFSANANATTGYVDSNYYLRMRAKFIDEYPDKVGLFDNAFAPQFLSQEDRTKLGIEKTLSPTDLLILGQ